MFDNPHFCFKLCSLDITDHMNVRDFMVENKQAFQDCELKIVEMHGIRICLFVFTFRIIIVVNTIELNKCSNKYTEFRKADVQGGKIGYVIHDIASKVIPLIRTHIERFKNSRRLLSPIPVQVMGFKQGASFASVISYFLSQDNNLELYVLLFGSSYIGDEKFLKVCENNVKKLKHFVSNKDHKSMWETKRKNTFKPIMLNERGREEYQEPTYTNIFSTFVKNRKINLKNTYENIMKQFTI